MIGKVAGDPSPELETVRVDLGGQGPRTEAKLRIPLLANLLDTRCEKGTFPRQLPVRMCSRKERFRDSSKRPRAHDIPLRRDALERAQKG